jgi:hypothetical protein
VIVLVAGLLIVLGAAWFLVRSDEDPALTIAVATTTTSTTTTTLAPTTTSTTTATTTAVAPTGSFVVAPGTSAVTGQGSLVRYRVEVEDGIDLDVAAFAAAVDATLADPRGWTADGSVSLQRVSGDAYDYRIRLSTPATTDRLCAPLETVGRYSCQNGVDVVINLDRWLEGAEPSKLPLDRYRVYVISHEFGHAIGRGHVGCPFPGALAPVMMQQTKGIGDCAPNEWPHPY